MSPRNLCIYHGNCADGFASACVIKKYMEGLVIPIEFHAGVYQNPPPDVKDKSVYLVDFSYKRPVMEKILQEAMDVNILDHHKTAIEDLEGLEFNQSVLDINRSGAMITWNFFFPDVTAPLLIAHIQDRDLWKFTLPETREIQAALSSYPYEFDLWEKMLFHPDQYAITAKLALEGKAIERKHLKDIRELLKVCRKKMNICGIEVLAANLPYTLISDAGHIMVEEEKQPFGCCYYDGPDGRVFSLRSIDTSMNVSEIAKTFGGGGHRNAAGFRVSYEQARSMEV